MSADRLTGYDPLLHTEIKKAVFGKRLNESRNPLHALGLSSGGDSGGLLGFRRTDADRKPARPVIRPNDGPGDMDRRYQLAEQRKEQVERKAIRLARGGLTYEQHKAKIEQFNRRLVIQALVQRGPSTMMEIADAVGMDTGAVSIICARMADDGLITKERFGNAKSSIYATPTDAGLALLAEAQA